MGLLLVVDGILKAPLYVMALERASARVISDSSVWFVLTIALHVALKCILFVKWGNFVFYQNNQHLLQFVFLLIVSIYSGLFTRYMWKEWSIFPNLFIPYD